MLLEEAIRIPGTHQPRRVDHRQPIVEEFIENVIIGIYAQLCFYRSSMMLVKIPLGIDGLPQKHIVTDQVGGRKILAG